MKKQRILLVDDHAVLRAGLRLLIESDPSFEVIGEAADGADAVAEASAHRPDLVLLDLGMHTQPGIPTIAALRRECTRVQILVLTMHADHAYLRLALAAGASGYLVKTAAHAELLTALHTVAAGRCYVDRSFDPETLLEVMISRRHLPLRQDGSLGGLSPREQAVFESLAHGLTNRQIAERLAISVKSAETYRARVMDKLALRSRADLVTYALGCGLLNPVARGSASSAAKPSP